MDSCVCIRVYIFIFYFIVIYRSEPKIYFPYKSVGIKKSWKNIKKREIIKINFQFSYVIVMLKCEKFDFAKTFFTFLHFSYFSKINRWRLNLNLYFVK